jgi:hypothetical protein
VTPRSGRGNFLKKFRFYGRFFVRRIRVPHRITYITRYGEIDGCLIQPNPGYRKWGMSGLSERIFFKKYRVDRE